MMNNKIYIFLTFALLLLAFAFASGCGKYVTQYSAPTIINRYPGLGTGGIGSHEAIWIKFSKTIDTTSLKTLNELSGKILYAPDMTATIKEIPGITPEITWSEDDTKLTLTNIFFVASPESRIHLMASREAIEDLNGLFLTENADLWNFDLSGLFMVSRSPLLDVIVTNEAMTLEVHFNNPINDFTLDFTMVPNNVTPDVSSIYWTDSSRTYNFGVNSWEVVSYPTTLEILYGATDIYGNKVPNGVLWRYILISP